MAFKVMQPDGSETGQLVVANWYASTNPIVTSHIWCTTRQCIKPATISYIYEFLDINIVRKMSKFADDTKLCHRARNPDDINKLQEDIDKLVEWANK